MNVRVEDLMSSSVVSLHESNSVGYADAEMKLANIRHLPVVDDRGHVVGMLSNRDIFRAFGNGKRRTVPVAEIMVRDVQTVRSETPADVAAEIMLERKIGALPVVGEDEQLVGIITETDFLSVARQALTRARQRPAAS